MAAIARLVKALVALAALLTSLETIARLAKFAWTLILELLRKQQAMSKPFRARRNLFAW